MRGAAVPPTRASAPRRAHAGLADQQIALGVHASIRAPGTRAHTRAVHPGGTISVRGVENAPPPSPGGMTRSTHD